MHYNDRKKNSESHLLVVGRAPRAEPVEALRRRLPVGPGQLLEARVDLDPGDDALVLSLN